MILTIIAVYLIIGIIVACFAAIFGDVFSAGTMEWGWFHLAALALFVLLWPVIFIAFLFLGYFGRDE